jgi:hypothetical protein
MGYVTYGILLAVAAFVVVIPLTSSQEVFYQLPTPYSYACLNDTCSRDKNPEDAPSTQSLAKCRLTCGEYRSIWPRPTGNVDLADELVSFKPQRYAYFHIHRWFGVFIIITFRTECFELLLLTI